MMSPSAVMMMPPVCARDGRAAAAAAVRRRDDVDGRALVAESDEAAWCSAARERGRYARAVNMVRTRDDVALRYECDAACRRP